VTTNADQPSELMRSSGCQGAGVLSVLTLPWLAGDINQEQKESVTP